MRPALQVSARSLFDHLSVSISILCLVFSNLVNAHASAWCSSLQCAHTDAMKHKNNGTGKCTQDRKDAGPRLTYAEKNDGVCIL